MSLLGLRFCARAFSSCGKRGPLFIAVHGPLTIAASLVAEHKLQMRRLSSCGSRAQLLRGMWDLPRPGLELCSLHRQADSQPLRHQGSPKHFFFKQFFFLAAWHIGSKFPDQGSNLCPLQWKCGALTTGLPGMSPNYLFFFLGCAGSSLLRVGFSLVVASGGYSSLWCVVFLLRWLLLLWSTGSRHTGSVVSARRLSSCG